MSLKSILITKIKEMKKIFKLGFQLKTPWQILPVLWKKFRMSLSLIVTLNLNDYHAGGLRRYFFVTMMKKHLIKTSFFYVKNHMVSPKLLKEVRKLYLQFYALPEEVKKKYYFPEVGGQYGFTPFGTEKGDGAKFADTKEFFQVGDMHPFPFVKEIPELQAKTIKLFNAMRNTYQTLLEPLSLLLGKTANYLLNKEGNSILRIINYPAQANPRRHEEGDAIVDGGNAGGLCAYRHRDINFLTLIPIPQKGLELEFKGKYVKIPVRRGCILVNAGLMLEHISNGLIKAGPHQVICEKDLQRLSIVLFGHPLPRAIIKALAKINGEPDYEKYPFTIAHDFLMDVLIKIELLKEAISIEEVAGGNIEVCEDERETEEVFDIEIFE